MNRAARWLVAGAAAAVLVSCDSGAQLDCVRMETLLLPMPLGNGAMWLMPVVNCIEWEQSEQ